MIAGSNTATMRRAAAQVEQFVIAGAAYVMEQLVELNNEGGDNAPPAPIDTQNLRGSLRITVGTPSREKGEARPVRGGDYPLTTRREARMAIQNGGFAVGDTLWARWTAPYANIIDGGRRPDKNGRMIGSEQAPDGWVEQGAEAAMVRLQHWKWRP